MAKTSQVLSFQGRSLTVPMWAEALRISPTALRRRLRRMSVEQALSIPPPAQRGPLKLTCDGVTQTVAKWAAQLGMSASGLRYRIARVGVEESLRQPVAPLASRRKCISYTHDGLTLTRSQWAQRLGVTYAALQWRAAKGWPQSKMFNGKSPGPGRQPKLHEHRGVSMTIAQWAVALGTHPDCIRYRLRKGWARDDIFGTISAKTA